MAKLLKNYRIVILIAVLFGLFFALGACITNLVQSSSPEETPSVVCEEEEDIIIDGDKTNILLLGLDARPGETKARSDTMILLSIDPKLKKAVLISIPRDTRVSINGSPDKICNANFYGGPELAARVVGRLLRTQIDYHMVVDFNDFKKIIDTLGGVHMKVEQRMYYPAEGINLYPGEQRLNGHNALGFVRYRSYAMGDIQRTDQQQKFIRALAEEVLRPSTVVKLPTLIRQVNKHVETNLGLSDMLRMANWGRGFSAEDITGQTLPGHFYNIYDAHGRLANSYWIVDSNLAGNLLEKVFAGETIAVLSQTTVAPRAPYQPPVKDEEEEEGDEDGDDSTLIPSPGHKNRTPGTDAGEEDEDLPNGGPGSDLPLDEENGKESGTESGKESGTENGKENGTESGKESGTESGKESGTETETGPEEPPGPEGPERPPLQTGPEGYL